MRLPIALRFSLFLAICLNLVGIVADFEPVLLWELFIAVFAAILALSSEREAN